MFNMQQMMKQAQQMKKKMDDVQNELSSLEIESSAGNGAITIVMNAKHEFKSIKIKPEAINAEDPASVDVETIEMLEDLITSAMNDATAKADAVSKQKLQAVTGGMNIPGLF